MADLSVNYCGITYKNPLVLASATPGWDGEGMRRAAVAGFGGVIPKTIGPSAEWAQHPRNGRFFLHKVNNKPIGMINLELFTTKTREQWFEKDLAIAKSGGAVMQVSIIAMPDPKDTAKLVAEFEKSKMVDVIELNVSCPMPSNTVGMHIGKDSSQVYSQLAAVKAVSKLPITIKLTPNVSDMTGIAKSAKDAGADGLTISNSVRSFAGVDIETGKPHLCGYGGYTGPAIRPITMRHLSEVANSVDIPLSAAGGVSSFRDVVEYTMLGATTVQMCTEIMWNGYDYVQKILSDLSDWMDKKGIKSLDEIRGISLPYIKTVEDLAKLPPKKAYIDPTLCKNCGKCHTVCFYRAIDKSDNGYSVDQSKCDGCGACEQWCSFSAVKLV